MAEDTTKSGQLVRDSKGRFVKGESGNPKGRPQGSKNIITLQKLALEEAFRANQSDDMAEVLALIVKQAKDGHGASQKLVWDANISKQSLSEDKTTGTKQEINVRTINVGRTGEVIDGDFAEIVGEENESG